MTTKKITYNDNNLAIAYYRYSSDGQDTSVEQQRIAAHEYANSHGLKIIKEYADEAKTGTNNKRPNFREMLSEVNIIKPSALILWKTDRFSRNEIEVRLDKKTIRDAGCRIHYVAEHTPDTDSPEDTLMENILEDMAAYYSRQLAVNIKRGQRYNYENCKYLGVKMLGYKTEGSGRHNMYYVVDSETAPIVQRIFNEYVSGKSMAQIVEQLNSEGRRTLRNKEFTINSLRKILKNPAYYGVYRYGDVFVEDGMPAIISKDIFDKAQQMLQKNKKFGTQNKRGLDEDLKPRFWLTGKLFCGECGESMQGTSGHSHTGAKYYYYSCNDQHKGKRGKGCKKRPVKKNWIEDIVCNILMSFLSDSEKLASLAVDLADYYKKEYDDNGYLDSLKLDFSATEKAIENIVNAIIAGASGDTINDRLRQYEDRKKALKESIAVEEMRHRELSDKVSVSSYFEKYANANMNDPETRELILEYFVDRIYLFEDKIIITSTLDNEDSIEVSLDFLKCSKGSSHSSLPAHKKDAVSVFFCAQKMGLVYKNTKNYNHIGYFLRRKK